MTQQANHLTLLETDALAPREQAQDWTAATFVRIMRIGGGRKMTQPITGLSEHEVIARRARDQGDTVHFRTGLAGLLLTRHSRDSAGPSVAPNLAHTASRAIARPEDSVVKRSLSKE